MRAAWMSVRHLSLPAAEGVLACRWSGALKSRRSEWWSYL
ncbi:MAG: hypothetical protein RL033_6505 [Pseudomonadota bacterium]